jgi:hypothetical protein
MAFYYRATNGLGADTGCVAVPYVDSKGQSGSGNLCADQSGKCGDVKALQGALQYLGYGPIDIDGVLGTQTSKALKNYAADKGIPFIGPYAGWELCEPMVKEYAAESAAPAAAPTQADNIAKMAALRKMASVTKPAVVTKGGTPSSGAPTEADYKAFCEQNPGAVWDTVAKKCISGPPTTTIDKIEHWWFGLGTVAKYAIIGGGVAVVGGVAYLLITKKPKAAVANARRGHRMLPRRKHARFMVEARTSSVCHRTPGGRFKRDWRQQPPGFGTSSAARKYAEWESYQNQVTMRVVDTRTGRVVKVYNIP